MQKIVILDFTNSEVHVYTWNPEDWDSPEDFIDHLEEVSSSSNCQWMCGTNIKITIN